MELLLVIAGLVVLLLLTGGSERATPTPDIYIVHGERPSGGLPTLLFLLGAIVLIILLNSPA
jgi:hypothetical protein